MADKKLLSIPAIGKTLQVADVLLVAAAGFLAYYARFSTFLPDSASAYLILFVTVAAANVFHLLKLYDYERITREPMQLQRVGTALLTIAFLTLAVGYLTMTSDMFSRVWVSAWGLISIVLLVAARLFLRFRFRQWQAKGLLTRRIAVVGAGRQGQRVVRHFSETVDPSVVLAGVFDDRRSRVPNQIGDTPIRGTVDDLLKVVESEPVDEVIIALPWSAESRLLELLQKLRSAPVHVRLSPDAIAFRFPHRTSSAMQGVNMLNVFDRPVSEWSSIAKRIEDQVLSVMILLFVAPLALAVAMAIKIESRGPILSRQRRFSFDSEPFDALNFRTHRLDAVTGDAGSAGAPNLQRMTRLGRVLWQAGLDQLPQFFNVLRGEMSIVGPSALTRKATAGEYPYEEIVTEYFVRHRIKPGITGWAQVSGCSDETQSPHGLERRIEYDLEYVERWSVWFDLKILLMTPVAILFSKGNY